MSEPVIAVENLGKRYRIRHATSLRQYATLREVMASTLTAPARLIRGRTQRRFEAEDFWALK